MTVLIHNLIIGWMPTACHVWLRPKAAMGYIGAWDDLASSLAERPAALPAWTRRLRLIILIAILLAALGMKLLGASATVAASLAAAFGLAGVAVMLIWSRSTGTMVHCTTYCPIGWLSCHAGKLSPFRLRIGPGCTDCGACARVCRYNALAKDDIANRKPGWSCTLCGDCVETCKHREIGYRFPGLTPDHARAAFIVVVIVLHAVFLGCARI